MKRRMGHYEREAWIMAGMLFAIIVINVIASAIVQHWPLHR